MEASGRFATPPTLNLPPRSAFIHLPCSSLSVVLLVYPCSPPFPTWAGRTDLRSLSGSPQLYAELRSENERLREALTETTLRLAQLKVELERATQVRCPDLEAGSQWPRRACPGKGGPAGRLDCRPLPRLGSQSWSLWLGHFSEPWALLSPEAGALCREACPPGAGEIRE